jgi:Protein of unknown function (DUF2865)
LSIVLILAAAGSLAWTAHRAIGAPIEQRTAAAIVTPHERIETRGAWMPSASHDEWLERLNGSSTSSSRRGAVSSGAGAYKPPYAPPSGLSRIPAVGSSTDRPSSRKSEPSGAAKKASTGKSKPKDGDDEDTESPWTKEEGRGTYRTLCVRLCDGYYFPISFSTSKDNFARDAKVCERSCKSPARLFFHENPGQDPEEMEDARGKTYKDLKVAFLHRKQYDEACSCKAQPWDEAALARHRQFAEAAERRKGGKKVAELQSRLGQAGSIGPIQNGELQKSQITDKPGTGATAPAGFIPAASTPPFAPSSGVQHAKANVTPSKVALAEVERPLLPAGLQAISALRRQSLAPSRLPRTVVSARRVALTYQTPVAIGRSPKQSRTGSIAETGSGPADQVRAVRRSALPETPRVIRGASAPAPTRAAVAPSSSHPGVRKLADGGETQVR